MFSQKIILSSFDLLILFDKLHHHKKLVYHCRYKGKTPLIILWKKMYLRDRLSSIEDSQTELSVNITTRCASNCTSNNKSCIILDHFWFIFEGPGLSYIIAAWSRLNWELAEQLWNVAKVYSREKSENKKQDDLSNAWKVSVFGIFLVLIFPHSDWIRRDTAYLSIFSPNVGKCGPEKLRIRTLLMQCLLPWKLT